MKHKVDSPADEPLAWQRLFFQTWYQKQLNKIVELGSLLRLFARGKRWWRWLKTQAALVTAAFMLAVGAVSFLSGPPVMQAAVQVPVTVTTLNDEFSGSNNGACSLREAIQLANGDLTDRGCGTLAATVISVPSGTITLSLTGTENDGYLQGPAHNNGINDLDILNGTTVTITGQSAAATIIQAGTTPDDGTGTVGNGIDRVLHVMGNLTLNNATIRHGLAVGNNTGQGLGGGIAVRAGTLVVNDSVITGNTALGSSGNAYDGFSGGIDNANGNVTLNNSSVTNNRSYAGGGGISTWGKGSGNSAQFYINGGQISDNQSRQGAGIMEVSYDQSSGTLDIDGATIMSNTATGGSGGGIAVVPGNDASATVTIANTTINGNGANEGGGITISRPGSTVDISNTTVTGNSASSGNGAGVNLLADGNLNLSTSTISGNNASASGGGIRVSGTAVVSDSLIHNNAANYGGGLFATGSSSSVTVRNTTISGNNNTNAAFGSAGVYASQNASIELVNATITGNTTAGVGEGNGVYLYTGGTVILKNTIVTNNQNSECTGAGLTGNNNLVDDATCVGSIGTVTNFNASLGNNGGPTQTHAITPQSNAVDAGSTADCTASGITQDQRNTINRGVCDIGAFEVGDLQCGIQAAGEPANYNFFTNVGLNIVNDGTNLDCLLLTETPADHPSATPNLQTGVFWTIEGLQSDRTSQAAQDFSLDMTLPHAVSPDTDAKICRHVSGPTWDCDRTSSNATTVTRSGITSLSDWTIGDNVGPTAVKLSDVNSGSSGFLAALGALFAGLFGMTWFTLRHRR
ncbi:MAG: choice-of-anchor Q domain-containing protein [Ardenticatenaceae bacterium]|nr:choice-of-anchor Q domain-containing protein [Ardenticatenaceae bacterium]